MRKALPLLLFALAACNREPDFDERYDAAKDKIGETAAEIDAQISGTPTPAAREDPAAKDKRI